MDLVVFLQHNSIAPPAACLLPKFVVSIPFDATENLLHKIQHFK